MSYSVKGPVSRDEHTLSPLGAPDGGKTVGPSGGIKVFTKEEIATHNSKTDCWLIVDDIVYDVTKFLSAHPGGKKVLIKEGGKDASKKFKLFHGPDVMRKYGPKLKVGIVSGSKAHQEAMKAAASSISSVAAPAVPSAKKSRGIEKQLNAMFGPAPKPSMDVLVRCSPFGNQMPFGDPSWYQLQNSPYYKQTHIDFRKRVRAFCEKEIMPYCQGWDETYGPKGGWQVITKKMHKQGLLPVVVGPPWPTKYVGYEGPKDYDAFHELIAIDEVSRCGSGGACWGLLGGITIGLPPVVNFGSEYLKQKVVKDCLTGEKIICLAITEPWAGSDVSGLRTTAKKTPCGKYYIVNGSKKWITNGVWADYFTVAVRTGGAGPGGLSLLLVEKTMAGVSTRHMKCMGVWASGTTYINFEDVKVPVENIIGKENKGWKYIMYNFNHERWGLICQTIRFARVCLEESFKYALKRKTFGKPLIKHQMIRAKIAEMVRNVEATQNWLENVTYQMSTMSHKEQNLKLGGTIALLKVQASKTFELCAREAAQIFGGASYVRGGVGEKVERLYRDVRAYAIPGGSEEIMMDFAVREAVKKAQRFAKL